MIRAKYSGIKGSLDVNYMPHSRLTDPVNDVLLINGIRFISEKNLKKLNEDWRDSYIFLNNIMERLKNKRKRLRQFNPIGVFVKRFLERKGEAQ
jgi:L-arabinose isomerase